MTRSEALEPIVKSVPVIPVVILDDAATAVPLARTLVGAGLPVVEITLRTDAALKAIAAIANEVEGAIVGAGTVLNSGQFAAAEKAGARYMVSPGSTADVLAAARDSEVPLMPGGITPSEAMKLMDEGYTIQKFFPAEPAGGIAYLNALASPLAAIRFCPTGGINAANAAAYLALPNVACVGGVWVTPRDAIAAGDWARIGKLAREAAALRKRG
ncbi:MAG: bifunctional 4-hydroxy-2-oxoglutarate aldolase/2-dehydro-3-deoxy-phosphogluconate aldolase [Propylenella sp.]